MDPVNVADNVHVIGFFAGRWVEQHWATERWDPGDTAITGTPNRDWADGWRDPHRYPVPCLLYVPVMSKDERKQPGHDGDDEAALEATEELSDDALENVSGGYMNVKNTTSPWPDQG